jgi:hypothetical protein
MLMGHPRIHPSPPPPAGLFPFLADEWTRDCVSIVSFSEKHTAGGMFHDYTARYRAVREEDRITLRQSMFSETIDDLKLQTRISLEPTSTDHRLFGPRDSPRLEMRSPLSMSLPTLETSLLRPLVFHRPHQVCWYFRFIQCTPGPQSRVGRLRRNNWVYK